MGHCRQRRFAAQHAPRGNRKLRRSRNPRLRHLHVEQLEDRRMLAVLMVNSPLDNITPGDNLVTLREAVTAANNDATTDLGETGSGADTILFDATVFATPQTIPLALNEIVITEAVTIDATALAANVRIEAFNASRIFNITATTGNFTLAGLTLTGGRTTGDNVFPDTTFFSGGAVRSLTTGNLTIDQSIVSGSQTFGVDARGGGIFSSGAITLTSSTVSGNSTAGNLARGGGIYSYGAIMLTSSTISGNSTMDGFAEGGGIFSFSGGVTLTSSTVSNNNTTGAFAEGGGIFSYFGTVTLTSSTVTDNHSTYYNASGGGIWIENDTLTITNSIVAGNMAAGGMDDINPGSGALFVDFSLIEQVGLPLVGSGNVLGSPANLGPLANNGGLTKTHTLLPTGNPATAPIDNGDPSITFDPAEFDQRGAPFVRVADGGVSGQRIDMGAYERQTVAGLNLIVDTSIDENDGDYSAGDLSLREAVGLANGSVGTDTITFDATVFVTPQTISLTLGEIEITEAVTINGPGQQLLTINAQQQSRIFNITATTSDFTLAGLTLTGGRTTTASGPSNSGGAIRSITTGNLTIDQSTVSGNSTTGSGANGGGIYSYGAVTLTNSTVSGNSTTGSDADGGGIFSSGAVTLAGSTVSGNSTTGNLADGGGIWSDSDITLTESTITDNQATGDGGGVFVDGGRLDIVGTSIDRNHASGSGGGISADSAVVTAIQSTIDRNTADGSGGGIVAENGTTTLTDTTLSRNVAGAAGGGILIFGGSQLVPARLTINNSTVAFNRSGGDGGGMRLAGVSATIINNSTIANNRRVGTDPFVNVAGGIRVVAGAQLIMQNTIVANNSTNSINGVNDIAGDVAANYSLVRDPTGANISGGNNILGTDPMLGSIANNGGPTETMVLLGGSPAIDMGDPAASPGVSTMPLFDQRGNDFGRVQNGRIDMGAYEVRDTLSADFNGDGFISGADFLLLQIGLGTPAPDAVKTDGDADNDLDADSSDLGVWELQYGTAAPIVTAASAPISAESFSTELSPEPSLANGDLVDVALAVALAEESDWVFGKSKFVAHSPPLEFFSAELIGRNDSVSGPGISSSVTTSTPSDDERRSPEGSNPWEDALDEVFASVFK